MSKPDTRKGDTMKERMWKLWERIVDEYIGVCKMSLLFVAGSVAWMEVVAAIKGIGDLIVRAMA